MSDLYSLLPTRRDLLRAACAVGGAGFSTVPTACSGPGSGTGEPSAGSASSGTGTALATGATALVRHPVTGLPVTEDRPVAAAVAVKVDDVPRARPQYGLHEADLVVEEPVEGGLTRLMAVYTTTYPSRVEPVRSARVTDAYLLQALGGGGLVSSGASAAQGRWLERHSSWGYVLLPYDASSAWDRDPARPAPHDLRVDVRSVGRRAEVTGLGTPRAPFGTPTADVPSGGRRTTTVALGWGVTTARWTWRKARKVWTRAQDGTEHVGADGRAVSAHSLVVIAADVTYDDAFHDVAGAPTPLPDLVSGGPAWLLRGGRRWLGRWARVDGTGAFRLTTGSGRPLRPARGRLWVELLSRDTPPTFG